MNTATRTFLVSVVLVLVAFAGSAQAAFSVAPARTFGIGSLYGLAPDGTLYQASGGVGTGSVVHYDDEGNNLGDGFGFSYGGSLVLGAGAYGGRVYMTVSSGGTFSPRLISFLVNTNDPNHDYLPSDIETNERIGGNQAMLRVFGDGGISLALGQENKIGSLRASDLSKGHPYYPQAFHGAGINKNEFKPPMSFEGCTVGLLGVPVSGEPEKCGTHSGFSGVTGPEGFAYPNDIAPGVGGIYVSEYLGNRITHVRVSAEFGVAPDFRFGIGPGTGAGQLSEPQSIVRQPGSGNLFVSEGGNRRISVFNSAGGFIAAFGYGVFDGADEMQFCGIEIGPCRAGVAYQSDSRSYFSRLDFSPDGELYAYMPLRNQIQVFAVSGGDSPPLPGGEGAAGGGSGGGPSGSGGPSKASTAPAEKEKVRLAANPLQVKKGKKTTLTAKVNPPEVCGKRSVLFQKKVARSWDNLGKALKVSKGCTASKRVKVTAKSVFRAVLINATNQATQGYSPNLTVKLK